MVCHVRRLARMLVCVLFACVLLGLFQGCVSCWTDIKDFSFSVREPWKEKLRPALIDAAKFYEWKIVKDYEDTLIMQKTVSWKTVKVEFKVKGEKCEVFVIDDSGMRVLRIRETCERWLIDLIRLTIINCDKFEAKDSYYQMRFMLNGARGCADFWKKDREKLIHAQYMAGERENEDWRSRDEILYQEWVSYEKHEVALYKVELARLVMESAIQRIFGVGDGVGGNFKPMSSESAVERARAAYVTMCNIWTDVEVLAGYNEAGSLQKTQKDIMEFILQEGLRAKNPQLVRKMLLACASDSTTHNEARRFADILLLRVSRWEFDQTPEGKEVSRQEDLCRQNITIGELPTFEMYLNSEIVRQKMRQSGVTFQQRTGLGAKDSAAEWAEAEIRKYNQVADTIPDPNARARFRLNELNRVKRYGPARVNYEIAQVQSGVREAVTSFMVILRKEYEVYLSDAMGKYRRMENQVSKEAFVRVLEDGIRRHADRIVKSYKQMADALSGEDKTSVVKGHKAFFEGLPSLTENGLINENAGWVIGMLASRYLFTDCFGARDEYEKALMDRYIPKSEAPKEDVDALSIKCGTGWFVSGEMIVTCKHVIDGSTNITIQCKSGNVFEAEVIAMSSRHDLALLRAKGAEWESKMPIQTTMEKLSSKVCTIGYPSPYLLGPDQKYSEGVISSNSGLLGDATQYQISVPIQPGNSGGALMNENGCVVGVTSSTLNAVATAKHMGFVPQSVNYAIKARYAVDMLEENGIAYDKELQEGVDPIENLAAATVLIIVK